MFESLSRSRFAPKNVCPSCLSTVFYQSNPLLRRIRHNNLSTVTTTQSPDEDASLVLSRPKKSVHSSDRAHDKVEGRRETTPKTSLSSNRKVIEELKRALKVKDQLSDHILIVPGKKGDNQATKLQKKALVSRKTQLTDAERDEVRDGDSPRSKADNGSDRKGVIPARKIIDADKEGLTRRVSSDAPEPKLKPKTRSRLASQRVDPATSFTEKLTEPDGRDVLALHETQDANHTLSHTKELPATTTPLNSNAILPSLIRKHLSESPKTVHAESMHRKLMVALQSNGLKPEERKLIMSQLRKSLLSSPRKTFHPGKRGLAKSRSRERSQKASVSVSKKSMKKSGSGVAKTQLKEKPGMSAYEIRSIEATDLDLVPLEKPQPPVPNLAYGLERVLFNPGVYHLRDPRSRVFNFDPYLESIMPVADFDFNALKEYITSSRDETLLSTAAAEQKKYTGSTSSMTSALAHFHFLLSQWRPVTTTHLSQGFPDKLRTFTQLQRAPSAVFLRWRNGTYAIDADKEFDSANILMMLGKSMEKLLTLKTQDFEKYRKENSDQISEEERNETESFHYTTMGDFLMRSQLDAYDPRIPGTGMFDLKTRAVVSIRMDAKNYHNGLGYEIRSRHGEFESYEREYYDMIRAAFLKYSLQVRMGRMDGIFVAFHNTERIFGFQYISLPEMDLALHGQENLTIGDSEFRLSLELLNRVLDRATTKFPEQSLRIFFETRDTKEPFMYIFAEPVTEKDIQEIQSSKRAEIEHYERTVLGVQTQSSSEEPENEKDNADHEGVQASAETPLYNNEVDENMEKEDFYDMNDNKAARLDGPDKSTISKINTSSTQPALDVNMDVLDSRMKNTDEDGAGLEGIVQEQPVNDKPSSVNESVLEFQNSLSLDLEGGEDHLNSKEPHSNGTQSTEKLCIDTATVGTKSGHTTGETNEAAGKPRVDQTSGMRAAGISAASQNGKDRTDLEGKNPNLLAMTLTIRNMVNGAHVTRPEKIGLDAKWRVEYALAEVSTPEQSQNLYQKTQRRRAVILKKDKKDAATSFQQSYTRKLARLSTEGRKWRLQQNEADRSKPVAVLWDQVVGS